MSESDGSDEGVSRRDFVKGAVAAGGASALAACLDRFGAPDVPGGPGDLSGLPERQHAWNAVLETDDAGNDVPPRHHLLLGLTYAGGDTPSAADREHVETALRGLERAYERSHDGLLFTVGYSPAYFDRFDADLPPKVDLPPPEALAPFEDPAFDEFDALLHLASDHGQVLLAVEEALLGERAALNGHEMERDLRGVLERATRRTGFIGAGLPAEHDDVAGVPDGEVSEEAPLFMGFKSGFERTQATEDRVTIAGGPFEDGTTQHASRLQLHLDQWYNQDDRYQRVGKMFCPAHAENDVVEGVGENLGTASGVGGCADEVMEQAEAFGMVGHAQKTARARGSGMRPVILRRDFDSTDGDHAGLHFVALQRGIEDFVTTREAMNGTDVADETAVGQRTNNGILQYFTTLRRGNYLLPPRRHRALPTPRPE